jgi:hypothetical protein
LIDQLEMISSHELNVVAAAFDLGKIALDPGTKGDPKQDKEKSKWGKPAERERMGAGWGRSVSTHAVVVSC